MQRKMQTQERRYAKRSHCRRIWKSVVSGMMSVVMLVTTCALVLPAKALENPATCGVEEHTHTQSCYVQIGEAQETELSCTKEAQIVHEHTSECWGTEPGTEGHVHDDACYTLEQGNLICQLAETEGHAHGSDCYAPGEQPVCQQEESEEHIHSSECYESELICTTAEEAAHQHAESCYEQNKVLSCTEEGAEPVLICKEPEVQEHVHSDDCKPTAEQTLICKLPEHTHALACYSNPKADLETEEVWKETLPKKLTGVFVDDLLAVAKSQLGYTESEKNYEVLQDGTSVRGYTRYGEWYGDPYGKWDGMFVAFCLHYSGADELEALADFPREVDATLWAAELEKASEGQETKLYINAGEGTPEPGDLVFLDADGDELHTADQVGILKETFEDKGVTKLRVYEGDCENQVQKTEYALTDPAIVGYGILPEVPDYEHDGEDTAASTEGLTEIPEGVYTYSDDNMYVEVKLPEDTTVPADAVLKVVPIAEGSEEYDSYVAKAEEAVDGTVENIALYDISFYTADGEYISVDNTNAKVSLAFNESPVAAEAEVQVLHFADEEASIPEVISEVTHEEKEIEMFVEAEEESAAAVPAAQAEEPADNAEETETVVEVVTETRTVVEFETDGFSTFAVIELTTEYQAQVTDLAGRSFIIAGVNFNVGNNTLPVLTSKIDTDHSLESCSTKSVVIQNNQVVSITPESYVGAAWEFEQAKTGTYYIKNSEGQYLYIEKSGSLALANEKQEFRVVAATDINGTDVTNAVCIQAVDNGCYVNVYFNNPSENFSSWVDEAGTDNKGNHMVLVECNIKQPEPQAVTWKSNLAGRSFIIAGVDHNEGNRILPVLTSEMEEPARQTTSVGIEDDQVISATLENYEGAVWKFEQAKTGTYYIKNSQTEQYLYIEKSGSLALANDKQEFRVVAATEISGDVTNAVCIQTANNLYSVNVYHNGLNGPFSSWDANTADKGNHLVLVEYNIEPQEMITKAVTIADRNDLAGRVLVITNPNEKRALTSEHAQKGTTDLLKASDELTVEGTNNDYTSVTIPTNSDDLLWLFEDAGTGIPGQYFIKSLSTGPNAGKYLHIQDTEQGGDKPLTLEADPQPIEVYFTGVGNKVNLRYHVTDDVVYAVDWYGYNGVTDINQKPAYGFGVWQPGDNSNFVLTEYSGVVNPSVSTQAGDLDGKTMVITATNNYNAVMTNNVKDGDHGMLEAQAAEEFNGIVGVVASDTELTDVSWTFTSVPDGEVNQYYIQDSNNKYLNISPFSDPDAADSAQVTLSGTAQAISVYENNDGTFVLYVTDESNNEYLLDFYANENAFSAWGRTHTSAGNNNKVRLTPVEEFTQSGVNNLDGKTLALISIYDANTKTDENDDDYTPKLALTSSQHKDGNGLLGVEVELEEGANGKVYTFSDEDFTTSNELWKFEAVENKPGVYYIVAANSATNNKKYLNIGNGSASVSDTKQVITVLSDTYVGRDGITYEVVYLRATVNGVEVYLRREDNGYWTKLYGDDGVDQGIPQRNFVLAQSCTLNIDVDKWINLNTEDWLYKPQFEDGSTFKGVYAETEGTLPTPEDLGAEPKDQAGENKPQHFVSFNFAESWDSYTAGKGRDFPQAYMASWAPELANENGYIDRSKIDQDDFIAELKKNVYDPGDFTGESPYWGVEYELTHYEVILPNGSTLVDDNGNAVKFAPGTSYEVISDGAEISIKDENGTDRKVPYGSTFKAQYREFSDILTFYINLYGMVEDTAGDIMPRYIEDFTLGLAIGHIYNAQQYAGDTENDYDVTNAHINSLIKGAYSEGAGLHAVIDGFINRSYPEYRGEDNLNSTDSAIQRYLSDPMTPALGASADELVTHVLNYIKTVEDVDIVLKDYTGVGKAPTLNHNTINTATFDVRWYVVKDQGDSWHIDGVAVAKTEPIAVTKTFYGLDAAAVNERVNYSEAETTGNYQIGVSIDGDEGYVPYYNMQPYGEAYLESVISYEDGKKTCTDHNLDPAVDSLYSYEGGSNPYDWTMNAILNQKYQLTEENYEFDGYDRVSTVTVYSENGETTENRGTTADVTGGDTTSVEFKNYYTKEKTGMFIVKKVDSESGLPLAGAEFTLTKDGNSRFTVTVTTDANGEAVFSNLKPGTYTLKETKAPGGYLLDQTKNTWTIRVMKGKVVCGGKTLYQVDNVDATIVVPLEIENTRTNENAGMFIVKKVDSESGLPLAGAKFTLTKDGDPRFKVTVTTNGKGLAVFSNLKPGTYTLKETKAPGGYVLDETNNTWTIRVMKGKIVCDGKTLYQVDKMATSTVVPFEIENTPYVPHTYSDELPQTGQLNWPVPVLAVGGLMLFAVGCMLRSGRKKEEDAE